MSTRPRRTALAKSYADAEELDVEMGSSGEEREGVERGGGRGRGGKSRKRASAGRDLAEEDGAASVKGGRRTKRSAARTKAPAPVDSDSDDEAPPPKKRKRRSNKKQKQQAKLEIFNTMPLDILSEICSHLDPPDLLHLSKTSKLFYHVLAAPGSKGIWNSARLRLGFPDLTAGDMSEIQYAELVFDYWESWTGELKPECLFGRLADLEYFSQDLWDLQDLDEADEDRRASLLKPTISRTRTRGTLTNSGSQLVTAPHKSHVEIFVAGRQELVTQMRADGAKVWKVATAYRDTVRKEESKEADRKRWVTDNRREAIESKVEELGWSDADFTGAWHTSTVVNKAEPLTDQVWESIKPSLIKLLAKMKAKREADRLAENKRRRRNRLQPSYNNLLCSVAQDERAFFPLFGDFVFLPTVRKFWEADDATFSETAWAYHLDEIFEEINQHSESVHAEAVRIVLAATTGNDYGELDEDPSAYDIETYDEAFFDRPTSHLFCTLHNCRLGGWRPRYGAYFGSLRALLQHQHDVHASTSFDCLSVGHFRLPVEVASAVSAVIELAGLEDDTATVKDLKALGRRLRWDSIFARRKRHTWRSLAATIEKRLRTMPTMPKKSSLPIPGIALEP